MRLKSILPAIMTLTLLGLFLKTGEIPDFKKADCQFEVPVGVQIECGYLAVPERRGQLDSPTIRLHVAIIKPLDPHPDPDPLVVLNGGPGGYTLAGTDYWVYVLNSILRHRTLILYDARGVGSSIPSLDCPEAKKQWQQDWTQNLSLKDSSQNSARALQACHDRLTAAGVDLSAYTTAANAADVRDLRRALGYSKWHLYGGAYGTRLALAVMQKDPAGIRSVILDSVYPPQVDLYNSQAGNLERSLQLLFERCAANKKCNRTYPDLQKKFQDLLDSLDDQPQVYRIYSSATGGYRDLVLNGDRWIWAVSQMFYGTGMSSGLPRRISAMKEDMTFSFGEDLNRIVTLNTNLSEGVYYSIQCREDAPLGSITMKKSGTDLFNRIASVLDSNQMARNCAAWGVNGTVPSSQKAVTSDIPTLILAGEMDPITPPDWGRLAGKTLSHSQFLEFPGFGHGVLGSGLDSGRCTFQIVTDFIDHPNAAVNSSCIQSLNLGFLTP